MGMLTNFTLPTDLKNYSNDNGFLLEKSELTEQSSLHG